MRLRNTIRPPERYKAEEFYAPFTPRSARDRSGQRVPAYVDYDPNLPPAAFPTLDRPRAAESNANRYSKEDNGYGNGTRGDNRGTPEEGNIRGMLTDHLNTDVVSHRVGHVGHPTHIANTVSGLRGPGRSSTGMGDNDLNDLGGLSFQEYMMEVREDFGTSVLALCSYYSSLRLPIMTLIGVISPLSYKSRYSATFFNITSGQPYAAC